jgi:hypothetical protein
MASFTVRVELHSANFDDYNVLHEAMESAGFSRQITSDDGITYHLPWAEYNMEGSLTPTQVRQAAHRAAQQTGRNFAVLVTEASRRAWSGLTTV